MPSSKFAERLNQCLNDTDAPPAVRERANILSKLLDIPKQQAWNYLDGLQTPDPEIAQKIADEFEVDVKWLLGDK